MNKVQKELLTRIYKSQFYGEKVESHLELVAHIENEFSEEVKYEVCDELWAEVDQKLRQLSIEGAFSSLKVQDPKVLIT